MKSNSSFSSKQSRFETLRLAAILFVFVCSAVPLLLAQGNAYLTGFIRDPSGAAIPAASLVIREESTGETFELKAQKPESTAHPHCNPARMKSASLRRASRNPSLVAWSCCWGSLAASI
jgi:hypothetical protein